MRRILIIGGGQAGLQLALSLLRSGYDVTLMTARTQEELYYGHAVSVQLMYGEALRCEREYGLNLWDDKAPSIHGTRVFSSDMSDSSSAQWTGYLTEPAQSVDERLKMAVWMDLFQREGGKVVVHAVATSELDGLVSLFDLTIVAAGHSGLAEVFPTDSARTPSRAGNMVTALAYVDADPEPADRELVRYGPISQRGHFVSLPSYCANGPCRLLYITTPADDPLTDWPARMTSDQQWERMLGVLRDHLPREYRTYADAPLIDHRSATVDRTFPRVRTPVASLPSGGSVLGMGDTVVAVSSGMLQDANNAAKSAQVYLRAILNHGERPFDEAFMRQAFEAYYGYARHFSGELGTVLQEFPAHVSAAFAAAATDQTVADRLVNGFGDPQDLASWLTDEDDTHTYLARARGESP